MQKEGPSTNCQNCSHGVSDAFFFGPLKRLHVKAKIYNHYAISQKYTKRHNGITVVMKIYFNLLVWNAVNHSPSPNYTTIFQPKGPERLRDSVPSAGQNAQDLDPGPARKFGNSTRLYTNRSKNVWETHTTLSLNDCITKNTVVATNQLINYSEQLPYLYPFPPSTCQVARWLKRAIVQKHISSMQQISW